MTAKERKKFLATKEWKDFEKGMLAKHKCCEKCGKVPTTKKERLGVHHLDQADYQNLDESKYVVLCWLPCHHLTDSYSRRKDWSKVPVDFLPYLTKPDPDNERIKAVKALLKKIKSYKEVLWTK